MQWKKRDKYQNKYIKRFLIFPRLFNNTWFWLETIYLYRRYRIIRGPGTSIIDIDDELATKQEYLEFKRREAEEREREKNERRAEKEKRDM